MEIIDGSGLPEQPAKRKETTLAGNIYLGVVLIAIGLLWLFYNFHWITYGLFRFIFSWPMLLVAVGGYLLAVRRRSAGYIIGGLGAVFLILTNINIALPLGKVVLPILTVVAGIAVILSYAGKERRR